MKKYHGVRIADADELEELSFPGEVQLAIDDLAGSVRDGLLALSVGVGLKVMDELVEEELTDLVGPKAATIRLAAPTVTARVPGRWCSAGASSR